MGESRPSNVSQNQNYPPYQGHGRHGNHHHHPQRNYEMTEEERRVFRECQTESFWYRAMPLAVGAGLITQMLISRGALTTSTRFGSLPKVWQMYGHDWQINAMVLVYSSYLLYYSPVLTTNNNWFLKIWNWTRLQQPLGTSESEGWGLKMSRSTFICLLPFESLVLICVLKPFNYRAENLRNVWNLEIIVGSQMRHVPKSVQQISASEIDIAVQ